ncbi:DUF4307 domain-containing protein [Galbitalea soli]|uniref:DUF4307 domain-containing protein n=1 Tax=Galbitalea soli TaxID=1268042 RepID=A0A7C9TQE9_9MICO|nr:DUF4307 domain-containing protein [Galbitalea soli]NYJ31380.1 hypothetical protein [Galbitalea soli]
MSATDLDQRYGRTKGHSRRTRFWAIGTAAVIVLVFGAWAVWAGLFQPTASIESTDVGNSAVSADQILVRWELSTDPGRTARCAVQALNQDFGIVGWKIVDVPPATVRSRTLSTVVRTTEPAVSGLIYRCWLP